MTIGFEETLYTPSEPTSGSTSLQVCASVLDGALGRTLQVVPEWREDTASGKGMEIKVHTKSHVIHTPLPYSSKFSQ